MTSTPLDPIALRRPLPRRGVAVRVLLVVGVLALALEAGQLIADENVRMLSVLLIAIGVPIAATLSPVQALAVILSLVPLPLYMQGIKASLLVPAVAGVWLLWLISTRDAGGLRAKGTRYLVPLGLVLIASFVTLMTGASSRTGADLAAFGNLLVGMALFQAGTVILVTPQHVRRAFAALVIGGYMVVLVTLCQYLHVGLPGLMSSGGTVRIGESGLASNLRIGGPFSDYELLAEFFGLVGAIAFQLGLTTQHRTRILYFLFVPLALLGIATTSTRSGIVILVLGVAAIAFSRRSLRRLPAILLTGTGMMLVLLPAINFLQMHAGTGFLFQRLTATSSSSGGFLGFIDRGRIWEYFTAHLPAGFDLIFGQGLAFDFQRYGTFPHSLPLTLIFTAGVLGVAVFAILLGSIAWTCFQRWRDDRSDLAFLGFLLVALFAINEMKIEYVRIFNYEWFVWALLGVCAAAGIAGRA